MVNYRFARWAEVVGESVYDDGPVTIILSAGSAFTPILPDVSSEATAAASMHAAEVMQYCPLMRLDDLRDAMFGYIAEDGVNTTRDNVLVTNGAKHATELALRV